MAQTLKILKVANLLQNRNIWVSYLKSSNM